MLLSCCADDRTHYFNSLRICVLAIIPCTQSTDASLPVDVQQQLGAAAGVDMSTVDASGETKQTECECGTLALCARVRHVCLCSADAITHATDINLPKRPPGLPDSVGDMKCVCVVVVIDCAVCACVCCRLCSMHDLGLCVQCERRREAERVHCTAARNCRRRDTCVRVRTPH
jgi:hypothetical protein